MQPATQAWWFAAGRMIATVLIGLTLGWVFGNLWVGLGCALALHLGWQLANLFRLEWWLRHRSYADPPDVGGVFGEIIAQIVRLHRRKRFHKQRFVQLMRQLHRSTAALPNGVVILNAQREITWFNRTAARLLELRRTGDLGLRIENLLRQPQFARYLGVGDFSNPVVIQATAADDCYLSLQVVPYGEGQQLLLVSDVSRQMRLEAMRKDFVANASHELRSPLTVISGYLETLSQDPALDSDLQGPVAEMQRQAERMTSIIRDLLALSRLEETDEMVGGDPLDIAALLAILRKDVLARAVHPRDVRVHVDSDAQLIGDEPEIHSAFSNIVDNAAKYTPADGSIEMRWWVDEHIPRLTERFYRVDAGRSRATGGSGLGLAIVKHVLQRHGATLDVHSTQGVGSEFICHFPASRIQAIRRVESVAI
jgi:two-component system phosphate regulon sensor histidine kinase PhoR